MPNSLSSLRVRTVAVFGLLLLPVALLIVYLLHASTTRETELAHDQARRWARATLANQTEIVLQTEQLLHLISMIPAVRSGNGSACVSAVQTVLKSYPHYLSLGVINAAGQLECSAVPAGVLDLSDRAYFRNAVRAGGFAVGDYQVGRVTGRLGINFGYAIPGADGRVTRVVYAALGLNWLAQVAARAQLPDGSAYALLDARGVVLARYPDSDMYAGRHYDVEEVQRALRAGTQDEPVRAVGLDGVRRVYAYAQLPQAFGSQELVAVVGIPEVAIFASARRLSAQSYAVLAVLALSSLILGWLAADRLVLRRVYAVIGATRRFTAGDRSARIGPGSAGRDELGQLATAFDQMAESVQRTEAEVRALNTRLEERVQRRTAQLEAVNKELESFSYSVSHDLRSPLRSIDGFSQALLEDHADQLDETARDYLRRVRAAAQRMGQLIDDLLDLARIGRKDLIRAPVDLTALADSVIGDLQQANPGRQVQISIQRSLWTEGDAGLLRVALANLFSNAWKFTRRAERPSIEFGTSGSNGKRTFFVRDNGAGFDMAYAGKLFGAFQRLHPMKDYEGTGVGLATVQRIITRHEGRIWAEAEPDAGATFYFTL